MLLTPLNFMQQIYMYVGNIVEKQICPGIWISEISINYCVILAESPNFLPMVF